MMVEQPECMTTLTGVPAFRAWKILLYDTCGPALPAAEERGLVAIPS